MSTFLNVLSVSSLDSSPCIVLGVGSRRVMFDCGEGTQRLCIEHKQRVSRLDMICFTEITSHTMCGMPGLCITASDANVTKLSLFGPSGLEQFIKSTKYFVTIKLNLNITELIYNVLSYRGEDYTIHAVPIASRCSYICERDGLLGKFDVTRAQALGIPKGPLYAKLKSGNAVTLDDGRTIQPEEVVAPTLPSQYAAIVCNTEGLIMDDLCAQPMWGRFYAKGDAYEHLECMIHLSPMSVVSSAHYLTWIRQFHSKVKHIFVGTGCAGVSAYVAATRYSAKLNTLFPQLFSHIALADVSQVTCSAVDNAICASPGLTFHLQPLRVRGHLDEMSASERSAIIHNDLLEFKGNLSEEAMNHTHAAQALEKEIYQQSSHTFQRIEQLLRDRRLLLDSTEHHIHTILKHSHNSINFLGTGCAVPSKYRNVSGIFIQLMSGGILLDAGEGTWSQLLRMATHTPAMEAQGDVELWAAQQVSCVWISHPHADHHLGLVRVIVERYKNLSKAQDEVRPLVVMAPSSVLEFLKSCGLMDEVTANKAYVGISNTMLDPYCELSVMQTCEPVGHKASENDKLLAALTESLYATIGIRLSNVRVNHCKQSYAVRVQSKEGWSIVYSGDTRPCSAVEQLASGATVLIHEATFDDQKSEEAIMKKHSTVGEAIAVSRTANVFRTILTHFSQRYSAVPAIDIEGPNNIILAFDFMRISFQDLLWAPLTTPALCASFPEENEDQNDDEDVEAVNEAKRRGDNSALFGCSMMLEKKPKLTR